VKTPHTSCRRGKKVRIVLRDGTELITTFIERTGQFVVTEAGRIRGRDMKSFCIVKIGEK
jgi:hypothetical protein